VRRVGLTGACILANCKVSSFEPWTAMHSNSRSIEPMSLQFSAHDTRHQVSVQEHSLPFLSPSYFLLCETSWWAFDFRNTPWRAAMRARTSPPRVNSN